MSTFEQVEIPFTVDHVGSFLRSERLKTARKDYFNEEITKKSYEILRIKK